MTLLVINIGDTKYSQYTLPLIKRLCEYNNINLFVLEEDIPQNIYGLHPSWLKLFCFDLIDDDFIICWDLDLAPKMLYNFTSLFDANKLNIAYDSLYLEQGFVFNSKFKYNCGLMGIPIKYKESMLKIYKELGKNSKYPSYEQYHINDWIFDECIDINLLDNGLNKHFDGDDNLTDNGGYNTHYTCKVKSEKHRLDLTKKHFDKYSENILKHTPKIFNTRMDLIATLPKNMKIAEIGVFKGDFSKLIFPNMKPSELILVDIFEGHMGSGDKDGNNMEFVILDHEYDKLKNYFNENKNVKIIKSKSKDFLLSIDDESLDMVYIDASHEYDDVVIDLELSYKKVKNGGFICGHDYVSPRFESVVSAVDEFCEKKGLKIEYLAMDGCPSYCIIKNR